MPETIEVTIDGKQLTVPAESRARDLLEEHAPDWLERAVGVRLNDQVLDFQTPLRADGELRPVALERAQLRLHVVEQNIRR